MRRRLPARRAAATFSFTCNELLYTATVGRFSDGKLAEIFLSNTKAGSHSDSAARDSIRHALLRDSHGRAASPLGVALDRLAAEDGA